jgi:hypothetical protein
MNVPAVQRLIFLNKWPFLYKVFLNYQCNAHFGNKHFLLDIRCLVYLLRFAIITYKYTESFLLYFEEKENKNVIFRGPQANTVSDFIAIKLE